MKSEQILMSFLFVLCAIAVVGALVQLITTPDTGVQLAHAAAHLAARVG